MSESAARTTAVALPLTAPRPSVRRPQPNSPLLGRLPAEIRIAIYKYVLGGNVLHAALMHNRPGLRRDPQCDYWCGVVSRRYEDPPHKSSERWCMPVVACGCNILDVSVLCTCQSALEEGRIAMYEANTFSLQPSQNIEAVLGFLQTMPQMMPRFWNSVRSLNIGWRVSTDEPDRSSIALRNAVVEMPSLRRVWIEIETERDLIKRFNGTIPCEPDPPTETPSATSEDPHRFCTLEQPPALFHDVTQDGHWACDIETNSRTRVRLAYRQMAKMIPIPTPPVTSEATPEITNIPLPPVPPRPLSNQYGLLLGWYPTINSFNSLGQVP